MGDVVDFKTKKKITQSPVLSNESSAEVLEISETRAQAIAEDRRKIKRTILTEFISGHAVVSGGLLKIQIVDINLDGMAFDVDERQGHFNGGERLEMRMYLNHQTYFPFSVKISHVKQLMTENVYRHGCVFMKEDINSEALFHFVKFLEEVSASYRRDNGDILVSKINS